MQTPDFIFNRDPESYKTDYGHALLVAGSYGKMGAAVLAARACLRAGVGLLTVHTPRAGVDILQTAVPEAMLSVDDNFFSFTSEPRNLELYDAIAVGPAIGYSRATWMALRSLLETCSGSDPQSSVHKKQFILDADALNILSRHPDYMHLAASSVITPHGKEYERLFANSDSQSMADMHGLVIVKKAHRTTIYAPDSEPIVNDTGNAGMATAGSGDVLTGITLGIMAQAIAYSRRHRKEMYTTRDIAALAVNIHGKAGDYAAAHRMQPSVIASDIVDAILL